MASSRAPAVALALVLAAAGCGSSATATTTSPAGAGTAAAPATEGAPTTHLKFFSSPDGNIGCVLSATSARCDVKQRSWKPPPAPKDCPLDYGQGVSVQGKDRASLVCAGDTTLGAKAVLPVGHVSKVGTFQCTSEQTGMQCGNTATGNGFTLSRNGYKLF